MATIVTASDSVTSTLQGYTARALNSSFSSSTVLALTTPRREVLSFSANHNSKGIIAGIYGSANYAASDYQSVNYSLLETQGTVTFNSTTDVVNKTSHGYVGGERVSFSTSGSLAGVCTADTLYYVLAAGITANTFQISLTDGGSAINFTGTGTGTHTMYIERATSSLTGADIFGSGQLSCAGIYTCWWEYTPYAVTTAANTWYQLWYCSGSGQYPSLRTSNGTNIGFFSYDDTLASWASGNQLIVKNYVDQDSAFSAKGVLGTGDTQRGYGIIVCRNTDPTVANVAFLRLGDYTLSADGGIAFGAHAGVRGGTTSSRLSTNIVDFSTLTVGTHSGFMHLEGSNSGNGAGKGSLQLYGTRVTSAGRATLTSAITSGTDIAVVDDVSIFVVGDSVTASGTNVAAGGDTTARTITNIDVPTKTITVSSNWSTSREIGGKLIKLSGGGIKINGGTSFTTKCYPRLLSNLVLDGVESFNVGWEESGTIGGNSSLHNDNAANCSEHRIEYSSFHNPGRDTARDSWNVPAEGLTFSFVNMFRQYFTLGTQASSSGVTTFDDVIQLYPRNNDMSLPINRTTLTRSVFENSAVSVTGIDADIISCDFRARNTTGLIYSGVCANIRLSNNFYGYCNFAGVAIASNSSIDVIDTNPTFSNNTTDFYFTPGSKYNILFKSCNGNLIFDSTNQSQIVTGSKITFTNFNNVANDDRTFYQYGTYQRTGYNLSDTTVWKGSSFGAAASGEFALRLSPNSGTKLLEYVDAKGSTLIGNNQNNPVTIAVRIKINSANYYAGTHILPKLVVTYDVGANSAEVQASASTADQQLALTITPTTSAEDIEVKVQIASDATGSDGYVYLGKIVVVQGNGVAIDTSTLSKWSADGLPLGTRQGVPQPTSFLDEDSSLTYASGTWGNRLKKIKNPSAIIDGEIIV